jgi:hypothetical protein
MAAATRVQIDRSWLSGMLAACRKAAQPEMGQGETSDTGLTIEETLA